MICPDCGTRLPVGITKCHFCGNEITPAKEGRVPNFVDKFVALFTLLAVFLTLITIFYLFNVDKNDRLGISIAEAVIVTAIYWVISPLAIKYLIDTKLG